MAKLYLFFLIVCCSYLGMCKSFAQQQRIDSLTNILTTLDTTKLQPRHIDILVLLATLYRSDKPDSMLFVAQKALRLSSKVNYTKGQVDALTQLGIAYLFAGNANKALSCSREGIKLARQTDYYRAVGMIYHNIANLYVDTNLLDSAFFYYAEALRVQEKYGSTEEIAKTLHNTGLLCDIQGDYIKALAYYLRVKPIYEQLNNKQRIGELFNSIGEMYSSQKKYNIALENYQQALSIFEKINNKLGIGISLSGIGKIYYQQKDYQKAITYHRQSLDIREKIKDLRGIAYSNDDIAILLVQQHLYDSAIIHYEQALVYKNSINNYMELPKSLVGLASCYLAKKQPNLALQYATQAISLAKKGNLKNSISATSEILSKIYKTLAQYDSALYYHEQFKIYDDSLNNDATTKSIAQLQLQYEYDKKETLLTTAYEKKTLEKNWLIFMMLVGVISLVIITVSISINRRKLQKSYEKLELAKSEIQLQKEAIQQKVAELDIANQTKNKLFSVIGHDLKSPLATLKGVLDLIATDNISMEEFKQLSAYLKQSTATVLDTLDNLLQWSYAQMKGVNTNQQQVDFAAVIEEQIALLMPTAKHKKITLKQEITAPVLASADLNQMRLVLRNLVGNAIKFTPELGSITLKAQTIDNFVEIFIIDTGIGINEKVLQNIFTAPISTLGTQGEKGTGLGLRLCKEFVETNGGELSATSEVGKGSTFRVRMPIKSSYVGGSTK